LNTCYTTFAVEAAPKWEAKRAGAHWATSHIEGLYFLGKGGILPITKRCDPVLCVRQIAVIGINDVMCGA
jgi:hypothetical protein